MANEQTDVKVAETIAKGAEPLVKPKPKSDKTFWESFKQKAVQLIGGLLMEKNSEGMWTISLGRVSFWLAFIPALVIWVNGDGNLEDGVSLKDISPNHLTVLLTLAGYNFGKKVADTVKQVWGKNDSENDGPG
jgi:hypothetical protein